MPGIIDFKKSSICKDKINDSNNLQEFDDTVAEPLELELLLCTPDDENEKDKSVSTESLSSLLQSTYESSSIISSNSTKADSNFKINEKVELCIICNDLSNGKHYGVIACEGCKGFFKRTVRKNLSYLCREIGSCKINEKSRNRCQHCRYKKCIEKGMKVEAVQKERTGNIKKQIIIMDNKEIKSESNDSYNTEYNDCKLEIKDFLEIESTFCSVINIEKSELVLNDKIIQYITDINDIYNVIEKEAYNLIGWIKSVPNFQILSQDYQLVLIRQRWASIFLVTILYRTLSCSDTDNLIFFNSNHCLLRTDYLETICWNKLFNMMIELLYEFKKLAIDPTEIALMKIILFYNFDTLVQTKSIKDRAIFLLRNYIESSSLTSVKFFKLCLLFPLIDNIALCFLDLTKMQLTHEFSVTMYDDSHHRLLRELVDIQPPSTFNDQMT